jgi:hypothetical protein
MPMTPIREERGREGGRAYKAVFRFVGSYWTDWSNHVVRPELRRPVPIEDLARCDPDYRTWYCTYSHPRVCPLAAGEETGASQLSYVQLHDRMERILAYAAQALETPLFGGDVCFTAHTVAEDVRRLGQGMEPLPPQPRDIGTVVSGSGRFYRRRPRG